MERDPAAALPQVICLGEALVDRLGPPGGDPATAPPGQLDDRLGGAPANVACGLARLGTPVAFVGRLGRDAIGEAFARLLTERGVNVSALQWDPHRPTRIVLVRRDAAGERRFEGFAGDRGLGFADQALAVAELELSLPPLLPTARWLQIGSIPLASAQSAAALERAVTLAQSQGVALALDVNWRPTFWDATADPDAGPGPDVMAHLKPLFERAALLKLAVEEAEAFFDSCDPVLVSHGFAQRPAVVITSGSGTIRWCCGGNDQTGGAMGAFNVTVTDTTGAGDAFLAGLLHRLCFHDEFSSQQFHEAIRFGVACGAITCQGNGAIDPQPDDDEVRQFLRARLSTP